MRKRSVTKKYFLVSTIVAIVLAFIAQIFLPMFVSYTTAVGGVGTKGEIDRVVYCFPATLLGFEVSNVFIVYERPFSPDPVEIPDWVQWRSANLQVDGNPPSVSFLRSVVYTNGKDGSLTRSITDATTLEEMIDRGL